MKQRVTAFAAGLLFAIGLVLGSMTDPRRVIGFLDVAGAWDPSLAFVMAGAIAVALPMFRWILRRSKPLLAQRFHLPEQKRIDARLVGGSILFGIGWGLAGYCPGPALVSTMTLGTDALVFAGSMLLGMAPFALWRR